MPTPPPIPPAERSPYGPQGARAHDDLEHRVRSHVDHIEDEPTATKDILPFVGLAIAALFGYALGALMHGRSDRNDRDRSFRLRPGMMPEPVATYRSSRADEDRSSAVSFR